MQGTLLGSLYGNLPEPRAGPLPVSQVSHSEPLKVTQEPSSTNGSSVSKDVPSTAMANDSKTLPSVVSRNLLLMPPPPRRRDKTQKRDRLNPVLTNLATKRVKDSLVQLGAEVTCPPSILACPTPSTYVLIPEETKAHEAPHESTSEDTLWKNEMLCSLHESTGAPLENALCTLPQKLINEYDPSKPNSYDEFVKERARFHRRKEDERRQKEELERLREEQKLKLESTMKNPSLSISGDEAWNRRRQMSSALFGESNAPPEIPPTPPVKTSDKGRGFAQKMLEKMGWKHGEGLGKEKQGIVVPLVACKTDKRSGVIIQGNTLLKSPPSARSTQASSLSHPASRSTPENVSRIILLTNLVGNGEVDSELESETTEEASKFGNLLAVKIVEVPNVPDDEVVRIFCEYECPNSAVKALASFNGRLFGGRIVHAKFYPEKLYEEDSLYETIPN